jgi:hypothetical protein
VFNSAPLQRALTALAVAFFSGTVVLASAGPAPAHRHWCHARHSCPSDTGSYECGDKGDFSMCDIGSTGGTGGSGGTGSSGTEPAEPLDIEPPSEPKVKRPKALPGGKVSVTVTAKRGARIVVTDADGETVAKATATGSAQTLTFEAKDDGSGTYVVTATDAAGNESPESDSFTVEADGEKPALDAFQVAPADATTAAVEVSFEVGEEADYELTVAGRKVKVSGEAGSDSTVREPLWLPNGGHELTVTARDAVGNVTRRTETVTVDLDAVEPVLAQEGLYNETSVSLGVTGPPKAKATVRVGSRTREATLDKLGSATLSFPLLDGTYEPKVALVDPFGRHGTLTGASFTVDTQAPALKAGYDKESARHGDVAVTITSEPESEITLREDNETLASGRLGANRKSLRFTPELNVGRHQLTV